MAEQCDILIVGGGLVGASLAIALDQAGRDVAMVEVHAAAPSSEPSYGERNLALARASVNGLRSLGVWPRVSEQATPIRSLHVSRAGEFGTLRVSAEELGVDALGHTLPARELGAGLQQQLEACQHLRRLAPARVTGIQALDTGWRATIERPEGDTLDLDARLLVAADGGRSQLRGWLGIGSQTHDYQQTLFVTTVMPEKSMQGRAFERFSDVGPVALLPLGQQRAGLVLTVGSEQADDVAALDDDKFLALALRRFGARLGRLTHPGPRHRHPIMRVAADSLIAPRAVVVGNAAQTIHPIGAQGFNLGLRDALTLAELVAETDDPGNANLLDHYAQRRQPDREGVMAFSHGLVRLACLEQPLLAPLRSAALLGLNAGPLKRSLARRGMGFRGQPPGAVLEPQP